MKNFVLENPTKIIFGKDTIGHIGKEVRQIGNNPLLVCGQRSIKENGVYDAVHSSLKGEGFSNVVEHVGVKSNPILSHVQQGIELVRQNRIDCILAVGGGSVIDEAKAIAAGALAEHDVWKFFKGKAGIKSALPIATVLTLPASASEMNSGMVITNEVSGYKLGIGNKLLFPKISILDPTVTYSLPNTYTAYGAIDAIAHILEFYFTSQGPSPVQDRFMEGLLINIMESCDVVLKKGDDYNGRANLMWCATMALNGWTAAGLGLVGFPMHMIEHSLSALYDCPHGAGLSVVLPAWLTWRSRSMPDKIGQFAERVFAINDGPLKSRAERGIGRLKEWFSHLNCPVTLNQLNINEADIPSIAAHSLVQAKIWRLRDYDVGTVEDILNLAR